MKKTTTFKRKKEGERKIQMQRYIKNDVEMEENTASIHYGISGN